MSVRQPALEAVRRAAWEIRRGQVIAARTDTLYGLLADARKGAALRRLFRVKGRPESKPIPLLLDSMARLDQVARDLPPAFAGLAAAFWPGPLTLVLPARPDLPRQVTAGKGTVAVRIPDSPLVRALARHAKCALTGTSANLSGRSDARSPDEIVARLGSRMPLVLDSGRVRKALPSTIVDLTSERPRILRPGVVQQAEIERVLRLGGDR